MTPITDDTFLDTLAIRASHVKNSSISTPRHLLLSTLLSEISFMETSSSYVRVATLCLGPTNINSAFKTLKASLFAVIPTCIHGYNGVYMGIKGYTWVLKGIRGYTSI